jgi:hypothetical protein
VSIYKMETSIAHYSKSKYIPDSSHNNKTKKYGTLSGSLLSMIDYNMTTALNIFNLKITYKLLFSHSISITFTHLISLSPTFYTVSEVSTDVNICGHFKNYVRSGT